MNRQQNQKPIAGGEKSLTINIIGDDMDVTDEIAAKVFEHIRKMKNEVAAEGLKAFMWQIEEIT